MNTKESIAQEDCVDATSHSLADLVTFVRGVTYAKTDEIEMGGVRVLRANNLDLESRQLDWTDTKRIHSTVKIRADQFVREGDIILCAASGSKEHAGKVAFATEGWPDVAIGGFMAILRAKDGVYAPYLYQVLTSQRFIRFLRQSMPGSTINNISAATLQSFRIFLPPVSEQVHVSQTLSLFEMHIHALGEELEARRKQYEHYRKSLFDSLQESDEGLRISIYDLFDIRNGYTPSKSNPDFWAGGEIPWFRMEDIRTNGRILDASEQKIPIEAVKGGQQKLFPPDSYLLATTATIGEHAWIRVPHLANQRFTSLSVKAKYREQVDPHFLYFALFQVDEWCKANTRTSSFPSVDMTGLRNLKLAIPQIAEQRNIVGILDAFEKLTEDHESGLPAEIAARRKQLEYYRNTLLRFEDASA